ncbi:hypothetical protein PoB_002281500 [Plakobranchus ocellatus]|uniref:Uncharacterized protein n=1 Tax=Plakobranchus ocellatus TaxID=259542 RepID=A0AAV3ZP04_9GAST|nr:hypothetical protein PoB_002281500 [Plakobranchus ocellatus]
MDKLQIYYDRAIRQNSTVEEMKTAIQASLHHCFSTDTTPRHDFCPTGPDSWCFFKSAQAKGEPAWTPSFQIMHCCLSTCSLSTTGCQNMSSCLDAFAMLLRMQMRACIVSSEANAPKQSLR